MNKNKKPVKPSKIQQKKVAAETKSWMAYKKWLEFFAILLLVFITYGNSINNGYNIDDGYVAPIDDAYKLPKKGIAAIPDILTSNYSTGLGVTYGYRPFSKVTMAIEYSLWENNPRNSHIINLLLYAINIFLLLIFIQKIAGIFNFTDSKIIYLAVFLFAIHPLHTEVVCSIKNREEILSFIFTLLSVHTYLKLSESRKWYYFLLLIVFVLLAFLSKQTAVNIFSIIFLIILFKEWIIKKENTEIIEEPEPVKQHRFNLNNYNLSIYKKVLLFILFAIISVTIMESFPVIGFLFILLISHFLLRQVKLPFIQRLIKVFTIRNIFVLVSVYYIYKLVMNYIPMALPEGDIGVQFESNPYFYSPASHSIPNSVQTIIFYLKKLLVPFPLVYYYGYNMLPDQSWNSVYPYLGILLIVCVSYWLYFQLKRKQNYFFVFWVLLFWLTIFPFSNLLKSFLITGIVGERLMYQTSSAFCLLLVSFLFYIAGLISKKWFADESKFNYKLFLSMVLIISIPYFLITINRNKNWLSKQTLYENDIKFLGNSARANYIYAGNIMSRVGKADANKLSSNQPEIEKAKDYFYKALNIYPKFNSCWLGLGNVYIGYQSMKDSALYCYRQVDSSSKYTYIRARELIGSIYFNDTSYQKAMLYYDEAFRLYPENLPLYKDMINILLQTNQYNRILTLADTAIKNKWPEGYANKGDAYLNLKDTGKAILNYETALKNGFNNEVLIRNLDYFYKSKKLNNIK